MDENADSDYARLVRQVGVINAFKIIRERGIVYHGDFTADHRTDPCFSTPSALLRSKKSPLPGPTRSDYTYSSGMYVINNRETKTPSSQKESPVCTDRIADTAWEKIDLSPIPPTTSM